MTAGKVKTILTLQESKSKLLLKSNDVLGDLKLYLRFGIGNEKESQRDSMPATSLSGKPLCPGWEVKDPARPNPMIAYTLPRHPGLWGGRTCWALTAQPTLRALSLQLIVQVQGPKCEFSSPSLTFQC